MIIKLAFRRGGTVDQALSNGLSAAAYAHATKDYKSDMHHAKAMGIGSGVGAGIALGMGAYNLHKFKNLEIKPFYKRLSRYDRNRAKNIKHFKKIIQTNGYQPKVLVGAAGLGMLIGGLAGIAHNAQIRTLRAAQRGQRD